MKTILLFLLSTLIAIPSIAKAATEGVSTSFTSVERGRWRVGGGFDFSYGDGEHPVFKFNPSAEHFFTDDFSFGGSGVAIFGGDCCSSWSLGPSATYYFWKKERLVSFAGQSIHYSRFGYDGEAFAFQRIISATRVGMEYFLTQSVSFSPALQWRHTFGPPQETPGFRKNELSLVGQFSIYF